MFYHFSLWQLAVFYYGGWHFFQPFPESRKMTFVSVQKKTLSLAVSPVQLRCTFALGSLQRVENNAPTVGSQMGEKGNPRNCQLFQENRQRSQGIVNLSSTPTDNRIRQKPSTRIRERHHPVTVLQRYSSYDSVPNAESRLSRNPILDCSTVTVQRSDEFCLFLILVDSFLPFS